MKKRLGALACVLVLLTMLTAFTASCSGKTFKINFYNGDTAYETITTGGKEVITLPANPVKEGYTFAGWFVDDAMTNQLTEDTYAKIKLKAEVNVYAKWTANDNTIIFNANGGSGTIANQIIKTDETAKLTANTFTKDGYAFAGWAKTADGVVFYADRADYTMAVGGITLFAKWTANDNTVIFNANGGVGTIANQILKTDETAKLTANTFTKDGYTFAGWAKTADGAVAYADGASYTMVAGGITLFAKWTANDNTVTFHANNGTSAIANQTIKTNETAKLTANTFTNDGYTFVGWAKTATGTKAYDDGASYTMVAGGITLFAVWTPNDNTVIFNANGGVGTIANQMIKTDETAKLTANTFTKDGYTFAGWAKTADGVVFYADRADYTMAVGGITLFAKWTANNNTVTFHANNGTSAIANQTIKTDETANLTANTFTKDGYTFLSWATTATGTKAYADGESYTMGTTDVELFAVWTINTYTLNFNYDGANGGESDPTRQAFYDKAFLCPIPTKTGFVFQGWYIDATPFTNQITDNNGASIVKFKDEHGKVFHLKANWLASTEGMAFSPDGSILTRYNGTAQYVVVPNTVTSIGNNAFEYCKGLVAITIPASVVTIGNLAFYHCDKLTSVVFESGSKLTSIGSSAFYYSSIKEFTLPASLTTLAGDRDHSATFMYSRIEKFIVEDANPIFYIDGNCLINGSTQQLVAGGKDSTIPRGVTSIGIAAFYYTGLTSIAIPNRVTSIGSNAFQNTQATSITIGSGVKSIDYSAFQGCSKLASITVDKGNTAYYSEGNCLIETLSGTLIVGCNNSTIPEGVKIIGESAFYACTLLTSIVIPNTVLSISDNAFNSSGLTSVIIPDSVTSIGLNAFSCDDLTSITIGSGVKSISKDAFLSCRSLTSITVDKGNTVYRSEGNCLIESETLILGCNNSTIPLTGVTSIGKNAFLGCRSLTSITIPITVTTIGDNVFSYCSDLKTINCAAADPGAGQLPAGWSSKWLGVYCNAKVVWGFKG